ncbi:AAA domain-containing protein [Pseudomonas chlororaphis]|uniref:AAA domain-containing protein n=1 Tax=Pseudomonas chlororaphis TaxID=587753 RepID=UPI00056B36DD|nr:AAA domain-containing protein [Pseudomonas chlororaphis]AZD29911.1 hypothetical protein C4K23_3162 [Pseudomonas chlororaphis]QFS55347.1 helicase [Pseudomonas chlororaphis subsp. aurantiaca]
MKNRGFDSYDISEKILIEANPALGTPHLLQAEKEGAPLLIKFWPRSLESLDSDLEDIWLHEIRQLHRLKGYPGVGDYVSSVVDHGRDEDGFYLVLDANGRVPISCATQNTGALTLKRHWLKRLKDTKTRITFWKNIRRIIKAIELLHTQGLLHRHLDKSSILTSADISSENIDFQLTGFEWSVRVHTMTSAPIKNGLQSKPSSFCSFSSDWIDLGVLIANLLGIDVESLRKINTPIENIIESTKLTLTEISLIRALIGITPIKTNTPHEAINAKLVESSVIKILDSLASLANQKSKPYRIAVNLRRSTSTQLKKAIQRKYGEKYEISLPSDNIEEMKEFIAQDLSDSPTIIYSQNPATNEKKIIIKGKLLIYEASKFQNDTSTHLPSWDFAFCHAAHFKVPNWVSTSSPYVELNSKKIEVLFIQEARDKAKSESNEEQSSWDDLIKDLSADQDIFTPQQASLVEGMAACHLAELSYARAEIYPIEVIESTHIEEDVWSVTIASSKNTDSESLSKSLALEPPAVRLEKALTNTDNQMETLTWSLSSSSLLNRDEDGEVILTYQDHTKTEDGQLQYKFNCSQTLPSYEQYFIAPNSLKGTTKQLSRRAKALDTLATHIELIDAISNPQDNIQRTQDSIQHSNDYNLLDDSKKLTLENIIKTMPLFLVQGPPGVGKTHLVTTLINQLFSKEPDSRILLSAQSHSTVQHLFHEVANSKLLSNHPQTLIIKCSKQDNDEDQTSNDADKKSKEVLGKLTSSVIFSRAATHLKTKISEMLEGGKSNRYSLTNQILNSANIVFSTTNSEQIEHLIRDKAQFDWSIMEETGKATGVELLSPLLLSHRRLMIGDHQQLPPYRSNEIKKILSDTTKLSFVFSESEQIQNYKIKGEVCKALLEKPLPSSKFGQIGMDAANALMLFESLVLEEESDAKKHEDEYGSAINRIPVGSMLTVQHRMHPHISDMVSYVFYDKRLKTHETKEKFYLETPKPFSFSSSEPLNSAPIVWIDMPDIQTTKGMKVGDQLPRWRNNQEKDAVIHLLKKLRAKKDLIKPPKLAVLSPYHEQVKLIENSMLRKDPNSMFLRNLDEFSKPDDQGKFCGTVDGFQGSEADIVIVSLVRNNDKGTILSSLGFLVDERRMNVLLSRAKFQLIIVGSYTLIKSWGDKIARKLLPPNKDHEFLARLIQKIESHQAEGKLSILPWSNIESQ